MFSKWYADARKAPIAGPAKEGQEKILAFDDVRFNGTNRVLGTLSFHRTTNYIVVDEVTFLTSANEDVFKVLFEKLEIVTLREARPFLFPAGQPFVEKIQEIHGKPIIYPKTHALRLFRVGTLPSGEHNLITDVKGVRVGHSMKKIPTGITLIEEAPDNVFRHKLIGAVYAYNGFGKTAGSIQVNELGTIETPIALTNTLDVPLASSMLIEDALNQNPEIGTTTGTVNALVGECNDGGLENIRTRQLTRNDYLTAKKNLSTIFKEGAVGAGSGMRCLGFKGGIGSSSRLITLGDTSYTLGVLVNANFGSRASLTILGRKIGEDLSKELTKDKGSIMVIVATDAPLSSREMKRVIKRAEIGIGRTGSYAGNGSGDIMIGFTTANRIDHFARTPQSFTFLPDSELDPFFQATADATEEAILKALFLASDTQSQDGSHLAKSLYSELDRFDDLMGGANNEAI